MWYYLKAYSDWWGKWRNAEVEKVDNTISEMIKTRATQQNAVIDRVCLGTEAETTKPSVEESKKTATENNEE